ncbi:hypothetical protein UZ36_01190 [Candidatus Nitromaritima sp. SCGC AAA799-C22]|nr:hypothetical protein UZ36_01190 [Candidatus Nitromaritima sp. SCGC AAA799-C22]
MTETSIPKILHARVSIRREGKIARNVSSQSLVSRIKEGRLRGTDEISADEKRWVRLDRHHQLARYFSSESSSPAISSPSGVEDQLAELSVLLKELNQ